MPYRDHNNHLKACKKYKENHLVEYKQYQTTYLRKIRSAVLQVLGGKCIECGFTDIRALQIDHIKGGGSKERKERPYKGSFHAYVLKSFLAGENKYQLPT